MWRDATRTPETTRVVRASTVSPPKPQGAACPLSPTGQFELKPRCVSRLALAGAATGLLSGLFGVGGGFVIVPALVLLLGVSLDRAVATSLFVISVVTAAGFVTYVASPQHISWELLGTLAAGSVLGMGIGSAVARWVSGPWLTKSFAAVMVAASLFTFVNSVFLKGAVS